MTHTRLVSLVCVLLVCSAAGAPVAAQSDDGGLIDGLTSDEDMTLSERVAAANDAVMGLIDRVTYQTSTIGDGKTDEERATGYADDLTSTVNANNDTLEQWVNPRFAGNASDWNVVQVDVQHEDATVTRYLVADVNQSTDEFSNARMVNSTDRSVDAELTLEANAAANAADELQTFVDEFAEPDKNPDRAYLNRMAQQYAGNVDLPEGVMGDE